MSKSSEDAWYAVGDEVRTYRGTLLTVNEWLTDEDAEEVCRMAAAAPQMLKALEYALTDPDVIGAVRTSIENAIRAAKGEDCDE